MADFLKSITQMVTNEKASDKNKAQLAKPIEKKPDEITTEFLSKLNSLTRSIRTLEERYNNLRRRTQLTDHNILIQHQKLNKELHINDSDLVDIKRNLKKLNDKINMLEKELELCAKKQDLDIQAKYISYWQPLRFLTADDAERLIKNALLIKKTETITIENTKTKKENNNERGIY